MTIDSGGGIGPKSLFDGSSVHVPEKFGVACATTDAASRRIPAAADSMFLMTFLSPRLSDGEVVVFARVLQQIGDVVGQQVSAADEIERRGGGLADVLVAIPVSLLD